MAEKIRELPPKAVIRSSITLPKSKRKAEERNCHIDVQYNGKPWLLGLFSPKDGTRHKSYYELKSQIAALGSAIFGMAVYKGSPTYYAAYDEKKDNAPLGFITKKLQDKVEGNDLLLAVDEMLNIKYQYKCKRRKIFTDDFSDVSFSIRLRKIALEFLRNLYSDQENSSNKNDMRIKDKVLLTLEALLQKPVFQKPQTEQNIESLQVLLVKFDVSFYKFISKLKKSYKLEEHVKRFFAESGLPELMAASYFLGEFQSKPGDLLLNKKNFRMLRIDHERQLWQLVRKFLWKIVPNEELFPSNAKTAKERRLHAIDVQHFPYRENKSCEHWFRHYMYLDESLRSEAAQHKAFQTWLFLVLIPDTVYLALSKSHMSAKIFEPAVSKMLLDRKQGMKACLNDSLDFIKFLRNFVLSDVNHLIERHNKKNPDCPLKSAELSETLRAWKDEVKTIKPKCEHVHQTETPHIRGPAGMQRI